MHRLFVGLRPPGAIRALLSATMAGVAGARWQEDDQLHLTLRYIGEVDRPMAEDVATALGSVRASALELRLAGVGGFGKRDRTDTLWAGAHPAGGLAALHRKLDAALVRIGLAPERRAFVPHITLARLNLPTVAVERWLAEYAALSSEPFAIDRILLFESHLGRERASYNAVARYPLEP